MAGETSQWKSMENKQIVKDSNPRSTKNKILSPLFVRHYFILIHYWLAGEISTLMWDFADSDTLWLLISLNGSLQFSCFSCLQMPLRWIAINSRDVIQWKCRLYYCEFHWPPFLSTSPTDRYSHVCILSVLGGMVWSYTVLASEWNAPFCFSFEENRLIIRDMFRIRFFPLSTFLIRQLTLDISREKWEWPRTNFCDATESEKMCYNQTQTNGRLKFQCPSLSRSHPANIFRNFSNRGAPLNKTTAPGN